MKAAIYARISTDIQRKQSIDDQLRECRVLCDRLGFLVKGEYCDRSFSGNEVRRPQYQRLLRVVRAQAFDVIVAHELSRLWRSESEMHAIKEELEYLGVHVVTDGGIDTRIAGMDILIAIKGALAKQELRQIAHRTHRALKGLALGGKNAGGKCYGYAAAAQGAAGLRTIDENQALQVQRIFAWYAAGKSPRWIADRLNKDGVPSPGQSMATHNTKARRQVASVGHFWESEAWKRDSQQRNVYRPIYLEPPPKQEGAQIGYSRVFVAAGGGLGRGAAP